MQPLISPLLLSSLLAVASVSPIWRYIAQQILSTFSETQRPKPVLYTPPSYLDVRPNAVGLALTTAEDESAQYFFLPLGQHVKTHNTPELPLHPLTAHIFGAVDTEGRAVWPKDLQDVECMIYPAWNRTLNPGKTAGDFAIRTSTHDGVVDFGGSQQPFWLGGREVEAYECW